jgi:hypothetical protein
MQAREMASAHVCFNDARQLSIERRSFVANLFFVYTNPASEQQDAEFNDWYTNTHLGEIVAIPGFRAATRYRVAGPAAEGARHRYLAIYELEDGVTPEEAQANLLAAIQGGKVQLTNTIKVESDPAVSQAFWEPISDRVTAS